MKATETAVGTDGMMKAFDGWTNKFIFPPYDFGLADCAVANFYHPESTLMMSTCSLWRLRPGLRGIQDGCEEWLYVWLLW